MSLDLPPRAWVIAERLFVHCHGTEAFLAMLRGHDIDYHGKPYSAFPSTKGKYTFMSEENYSFATFMQGVPNYKYLRILEDVVFDECAAQTAEDNWNYYGEFIKQWYPALIDLLHLAGIVIDETNRKLSLPEGNRDAPSDHLLPHPLYDPFLDHIRKETNESYADDRCLAVMFLSRKLLEAMVVRVSEVVFPKLRNGQYVPTNHDIWYDRKRNTYRGFGRLLDAWTEHAAAFHEDKGLVEEFCSMAKPLKNETNVVVHADYKIPDAAYVRQWRVAHVVSLGRRLFRKYCNP